MSLSGSLRSVLRERGIRSFAQLAEKLGVKRSTVSHHVSTLDRTRNLKSKFIADVAAELGIPVDELVRRIEQERAESAILGDLVQELQIHDIPPASFVRDGMTAIFGALPRGSKYYFATHERPWEFGDDAFGEVIAGALAQGVEITYFFPDPRESNDGDDRFYQSFSNLVGNDFAWTQLERSYKFFKNKLRVDYELDEEKIDLLKACLTRNMFLCNPLQRLGYIYDPNDEEHNHDGYAIIELVFGIENTVGPYKIWQPLNKPQTQIVRRAFIDAQDKGEFV